MSVVAGILGLCYASENYPLFAHVEKGSNLFVFWAVFAASTERYV